MACDEPEHVLCKRWRVEKMELTREQLSTLTGFSASMIKDYERPNRVIDENARKRYRLACAAVELGIDFDWEGASLLITQPVHITTGPSSWKGS
ncbi:XRE family transcriptional regulator [Rhizobium leguminosarum bv. viciae]|nr:XRE family transcriptional regulator [Rhizobium leguminosarum bv. viciae]